MTGQNEIEHYRDYIRSKAKEFELRYDEIDGSTALIEKFLHGPWDEEFVVVACLKNFLSTKRNKTI